MAQAKDISNLAEEVKKRLDVDQNSAREWINSQGTSEEVCELYDKAVRDLYWLEKSASGLVIIGRAGVDFCLQEAEKYHSTNPNLAEKFKAQAKTIAYNVAANSWPGWGDEGVTIASKDIEAGLQAAQLNLKLAFDLKKPDDKVAAAYWLLSALQLALGQFESGASSIDRSIDFAKKARDRLQEVFSVGFKGLILMASGDSRLGKPLFEKAVKDLKTIGSDGSNGYAGQLETARLIFVR